MTIAEILGNGPTVGITLLKTDFEQAIALAQSILDNQGSVPNSETDAIRLASIIHSLSPKIQLKVLMEDCRKRWALLVLPYDAMGGAPASLELYEADSQEEALRAYRRKYPVEINDSFDPIHLVGNVFKPSPEDIIQTISPITWYDKNGDGWRTVARVRMGNNPFSSLRPEIRHSR
jgi:hypothetical protein